MNSSGNVAKDFNVSNAQPQEPLEGGAKRRPATKKTVKKTDSKSSPRKVSKKVDNSKSSKSSKSKQDEKKGGSFVADVQNLAVPFAILLAKEGLSKVFKKDEKTAKSSVSSAKTASKPSSLRRRSTMSGGSCNLGCGAMSGGRAARELFQLQKEIDNFLEKY